MPPPRGEALILQGGGEDGRYARARIWGFEPQGDTRKLRSFRVVHHGSNDKNLAELPSEPPRTTPLHPLLAVNLADLRAMSDVDPSGPRRPMTRKMP